MRDAGLKADTTLILPDLIKEVLSMDDEIQKLATELYHQKSVLIMGRGYHYATCLEGALVRDFFIWNLFKCT